MTDLVKGSGPPLPRRRLRCLASLLVAGSLAAAGAGCAPSRPQLPTVPSQDLPEPWIEALASEPCPPPFWARLRIRAEMPGQPAVTLEGTLQAIAPDSLRLTARFGAWRPAFVLLARADSAELLVHETARYWITGRRSPDWSSLDPAAWATSLAWLLCPGELFRGFRPKDAGRVSTDRWTVEGRLAGTPWTATATLHTRSRALVSLDVAPGSHEEVRVRASGHEYAGGAWLPQRMEMTCPREGFVVRIELLGAGELGAPASFELLRPVGWTRHRSERFGLWRPEPE